MAPMSTDTEISSAPPCDLRGEDSYPGSKAGAGVWQRIISCMPAHENYFEPFLGHGIVLRRKKPAPGINVGCDVDAGVIDWWASRPASPNLAVSSASSHMASVEAIDGLGDAVRIVNFGVARVLQIDALQILTTQHPAMMDPKTLVYLDPPYLREVRTRLFYDHEFETFEQHTALLTYANMLPCYMMVSHYDCELYRRYLCPPKWRHISYNAMTRGGLRREFLWMNFPEGLPLHDCRWVGEGFRERERIGRKRERWRKRFQAMPVAERQVIREALDAVG